MNLFNLGGLISNTMILFSFRVISYSDSLFFLSTSLSNLYIIRYLRDCVNERIVNNRGDQK